MGTPVGSRQSTLCPRQRREGSVGCSLGELFPAATRAGARLLLSPSPHPRSGCQHPLPAPCCILAPKSGAWTGLTEQLRWEEKPNGDRQVPLCLPTVHPWWGALEGAMGGKSVKLGSVLQTAFLRWVQI